MEDLNDSEHYNPFKVGLGVGIENGSGRACGRFSGASIRPLTCGRPCDRTLILHASCQTVMPQGTAMQRRQRQKALLLGRKMAE